MLKTDKIKFNMNLWKDIEEFPKYNELYELSKHYYNNALKFLFCDKDKFFLVIKFRFINNQVEVEANYFFTNRSLDNFNLNFGNYIYHLDEKEFDKNIKTYLKDYCFNDEVFHFLKFAFLPDIYEMIQNSVDI